MVTQYIKNRRRYFRYKIVFLFLCLILVYLLWKFCILYYIDSIIRKIPIYPLLLGFSLASARSLVKMCFLLKKEKSEKEEKEIEKKLTKSFWAWFWTYFVNYPVVLILAHILGVYFSRNCPYYISYAILFGSGFFIDTIFEKNINLIAITK